MNICSSSSLILFSDSLTVKRNTPWYNDSTFTVYLGQRSKDVVHALNPILHSLALIFYCSNVAANALCVTFSLTEEYCKCCHYTMVYSSLQ